MIPLQGSVVGLCGSSSMPIPLVPGRRQPVAQAGR
jgi:hypothetical protein